MTRSVDPRPLGSVRPARPDDVPHLAAMVAALAAHHGDTATLTEDDLHRDLFGPPPWLTVLVAEDKGTVIGYAALCPLMQLQFGARGMDMHHLFVEPAHRGRGVGQALVAACRTAATQARCRYLSVGTHPDNHAAQAFYERQGFQRRDGSFPRFALRLDG